MDTKLEKPIRVNSNLVNGEHLSCGVNSIMSILYSLGFTNINIEELNNKLIEKDIELRFGGIYKIEKLIQTLENIKSIEKIKFNYEIQEFSTDEELHNILKNKNKYALVCYYALQGFVRVSNHPSMEHAHFGIIYNYNPETRKISGSQSNSKADKLGCLDNVDINKFVDSCNIVNKTKVNWGKYNKCKIYTSKSCLEHCARCGEDSCKLGLNDTSECIYYPTIGNKLILINK